MDRSLSHRLHRGRSGRRRLDGLGEAHRESAGARATCGRRSLLHQRRAPGPGHRRERRERHPHQGEPNRHTHGDLAVHRAGVALLGFAVWGGEYGSADWITIRRQLAEERTRVAALRMELDSLAKLAHDLETNPAVQERVAREQFGMIRDGEVLYRVVPK